MPCIDSGLGGTSRYRSGGRRGILGTLVFTLCEEQVFQATAPVAPVGLFDEYVLTDEEFLGLGPGEVDIILHSEGTNFTSHFTYEIILQFKYKSGKWTDAIPKLLALQPTGDYVIGDPFADRKKLGVAIRIVLRTQVAAGAAAPTHHGTLNITAAVRLYTGC